MWVVLYALLCMSPLNNLEKVPAIRWGRKNSLLDLKYYTEYALGDMQNLSDLAGTSPRPDWLTGLRYVTLSF